MIFYCKLYVGMKCTAVVVDMLLLFFLWKSTGQISYEFQRGFGAAYRITFSKLKLKLFFSRRLETNVVHFL